LAVDRVIAVMKGCLLWPSVYIPHALKLAAMPFQGEDETNVLQADALHVAQQTESKH